MDTNFMRVDILRLSSEEKPLDIPDGSTCYVVDTGDFFIKYNGQWYQQ